MNSFLKNIDSPIDLRKLERNNLPELSAEIREFILETLSVKPGHLGAGLGVVELTVALHYFFNTPEDLLIWDVGHQSYPHKILTSRKTIFNSLRQLNGISGFPSREESEFDVFGTGHSSTSISAITGMAFANQINGKSNQHIAVIGDASIVSGMALEGLNHLGSTDLDVLIILNDNSIGIDPSVGALKEHFRNLGTNKVKPIFEEFGFHYKGVIDGHDFDELFNAFEDLSTIKKPKLLHIKTIKGKGYSQAENDQVKWHSPGLFNKETGEISINSQNKLSFQFVFGSTIKELMCQNQNIVALTPAMLTGSNLIDAKNEFPNRVLDTGITEQHSVTFAAGLATQGIVPYCTIYSTFLQRAVDQVVHDVALQDLPVVFCVDRAGLVGTDGATHHGYFDVSFLNSIPNLVVSSPMDAQDFQNLLFTAQFTNHPFAIRFPKANTEVETLDFNFQNLKVGKAVRLKRGTETAILTFGPIGARIQKIWSQLNHPDKFGHYKFIFCKPLDIELLDELFNQYNKLITFEDGVRNGGFGEAVLNYANQRDFHGKIIQKAYPDEFITHGSMTDLEKLIGTDEASIIEFLNQF